MAKYLLTLTAVLEAATGIAMLSSPAPAISLLIGASLDAPGALVIARVTGAAILSLALACWLARNDGQTRAGRGVIAAMLVYNIAVVAVFPRSLGPGSFRHRHLAGCSTSPRAGDLVRRLPALRVVISDTAT